MIHHFNVKPTVWHAKPLDFSWDDATGEVVGPDAHYIIKQSSAGGCACHPCPMWPHQFSAEPLKSKTDMAAIIGWEHELPPELAEFYPKLPDDGIPEKSYMGEDGIEVIGRDQLVY